MTVPSPTVAVLDSFGDAIDFIFTPQTTRFQSDKVGGPDQVLEYTVNHLEVSFLALAAAIALALPIGIALGHYGKGELIAVTVGNAGRAVPELALIAFFLAFVGVGLFNLTLALMVLAVPPILTNAYVGIRQVSSETVDAARGMGMTELEVVRKVELPLAVPTIMGGVRTGAIAVVATATLGPLVGVVTLGDFIINRNVYGDEGVLAGAILVAVLALLIEFGLAGIQRLLTPRGVRPSLETSAA